MNVKPAIFTLLSALAAFILFLSACAGSFSGQPTQSKGDEKAATSPGAPVPSEFPGQETSEPDGLRPTHTLSGLGTDEIPPSLPQTSEVPQDILNEIFSDLVERTGAARGDIHVISAEAVVWNDGALGCPLPGEAYIQIMIEGIQVVLEVEGVEYDYRASDSGDFKICAGGSLQSNASPDTSDQTDNPIIVQAKEDLAKRLGVQISEIELLSFEEVVWPDSSLGCPQPGMAYAQMLTPGFLIILSVDDQAYEYHASRGTEVIYCENPELPVPGEPPDV